MVHPLVLSNPSTDELLRRAPEISSLSTPSMVPPHAASAPAMQSIETYSVFRFIGVSRPKDESLAPWPVPRMTRCDLHARGETGELGVLDELFPWGRGAAL